MSQYAKPLPVLRSSFNPGIPLSNYTLLPRNASLARDIRTELKAHRLTDPGWTQVFGTESDAIPQGDYYKKSLWVFACVNAIADNVGAVPFKIYKGDSEEAIENESDPVYRLFRDVNPTLSRYQLFQGLCVFMDSFGECMWMIEGKPKPTEIWMFRPDNFRQVVKDGGLVGWVYRQGTKEIPLAPFEVVHFKRFNPYDSLRGMNPLQVASLAVEQDFFAQKYNHRFFKNDGTPGLALATDQKLTDTQYERVREDWQNNHMGLSKAHSIAILESGLKIERSNMGQREMEFSALRKMSREEIAAVYKVPPAEVGIMEHSRAFANTKSQDKNFWQKTLIPRCHYIEDVLSTNFFPAFAPGYAGRFDLSVIEALQEDLGEKIKTGKNLWSMGYPLNAINERLSLGMPEIKGGEVGYLPQNYIPVTGEVPEAPAEAPKQITDSSRKVGTPIGHLRIDDLDEIKKRYTNALRVEMEVASSRLQDWMKENGKTIEPKKGWAPETIEEIFKDWKGGWKAEGAAYLKEAFNIGINTAREMLGDMLSNPDYLETILIRITSKNDVFVAKRIDAIMTQLGTDLAEVGWTGPAAADIARRLIDRNTFRASTFANFTISAAHEPFYAEAAARDLMGIWHITGDGNECGDCLFMASGNPWVVKEMPRTPGADVTCNGRCRCYVELYNQS
ncbi:MAG: phage portal protein [Proteobacteria bacterium]|nr:phage portal protein [Pseudomonadota bacterium]